MSFVGRGERVARFFVRRVFFGVCMTFFLRRGCVIFFLHSLTHLLTQVASFVSWKLRDLFLWRLLGIFCGEVA